MSARELIRLAVKGAAAGAAGTTALNAVTYVDMALRGRRASDTPTRTVEQIADRLSLSIPGQGDRRTNRVSGLGGLGGLLTGVALGTALGIGRRIGLPGGSFKGGLVTAAVAMIGANGPMVALRITDPRDWSSADWFADVVPHLAYGLVTTWTLDELGAE